MSIFAEIAGMAAREGAEAAGGWALRRQAGKMAADQAAKFAASKVGQRAAARVVGERGANYLASQSGQRATRFVVNQGTKSVLRDGGGGGGGGTAAPKTITPAPPSDPSMTASSPSTTNRKSDQTKGPGFHPLGAGTPWWQMDTLKAPQAANYNWRTLDDSTVAKGQSRPWGLGTAFKSGLSKAVRTGYSRPVDEVEMPAAQGAIGPASIGALGQGNREGRRVTSFPELGPGPSYEGSSSRNGAFNDGRVNGAIPVAPPAGLARGPLVVPPPRALGPGATAPVVDPVAAARDRPAGANPLAIKKARTEWPGNPGVRY
jgi:hypothetical protein